MRTHPGGLARIGVHTLAVRPPAAPDRPAPACMTPEEFALWVTANEVVRDAASSPCADCPRWFAEQMRRERRCDGTPGVRTGRPRRQEA